MPQKATFCHRPVSLRPLRRRSNFGTVLTCPWSKPKSSLKLELSCSGRWEIVVRICHSIVIRTCHSVIVKLYLNTYKGVKDTIYSMSWVDFTGL